MSVLRMCLLRGVHTIGFCTQLNYASWPFWREPKGEHLKVWKTASTLSKSIRSKFGILTDRKHKTRHLRIRLVPFQMTFSLKLRSKVTETYWRTDWRLRITARPQDYSRRFKNFWKMTQFWEFLHERILTSIEIFEIHLFYSYLKPEFVSNAYKNGFIWAFLFPKH